MKKSIFGILALAGCIGVLSCSDEKEVQEDLTVAKQQSLIERSIIDLTDMIPASDFEELVGFVHEVAGIAMSMDMSGVYLIDSLHSSMKMVGDTVIVDTLTDVSYMDQGYGCVIAQDFVAFSETSLLLSNFTGHYTATDTMTWAYTKANDLQFIFKDTLGNDCVLKLSRQGKEVKILSPNKKTYLGGSGYDRDVKDDTVYYTRVLVSSSYEVNIPQSITVSLSKNKKDVVSATVKTKLDNLSDGYFNIGTSNIGLETTLSTNNGYKLSLSGDYKANKAVSTGISLKKSNNNVLSLNLSADPEGIPSYELSGDFDFKEIIDSLENCMEDINAKNLYLSGNVMNEVKFVGSISDIVKYMELTDSVKKVVKSEIKTKAIGDELNKNLNVYIAFNGSDKKQAKLVFEPVCDVYYNGSYWEEMWSLVPVIALADGSRTSLREFFDIEQYQVAMTAVSRMMRQYERVIMTGSASRRNPGKVKYAKSLD